MSMLPLVRNFRTVNSESFLFTTHPKNGELSAHLVFNHATGVLTTHDFKALPRLEDAVGPAELTLRDVGGDVRLTLNFDSTSFDLAGVPGSINRQMLEAWLVEVNPFLLERVVLTSR